MNKEKIVSEIRGSIELLNKVIDGIERIETDDTDIVVSISMFEFMEKIGKIEIEIYNYLKERKK